MKKSKIILGITAGVLAITVAIGGTLMLFTADTATATNVITLSPGIAALLEEYGNNGYTGTGRVAVDAYTEVLPNGVLYDASTSLDQIAFGGINYGTLIPNQPISKHPRVARKDVGGADAYVRATATWDIKTGQGVTVELATLTTSQQAVLSEILDQIYYAPTNGTLGADWVYENGYFYYVDSAQTALQVLEAPAANTLGGKTYTGDIFTGFTVPNFDVPAELAAFTALSAAGYTFNIIVTAELVQSNFNAGGETFAAYFEV